MNEQPPKIRHASQLSRIAICSVIAMVLSLATYSTTETRWVDGNDTVDSKRYAMGWPRWITYQHVIFTGTPDAFLPEPQKAVLGFQVSWMMLGIAIVINVQLAISFAWLSRRLTQQLSSMQIVGVILTPAVALIITEVSDSIVVAFPLLAIATPATIAKISQPVTHWIVFPIAISAGLSALIFHRLIAVGRYRAAFLDPLSMVDMIVVGIVCVTSMVFLSLAVEIAAKKKSAS